MTQRIVIVGGGSAGWITANLLDSVLNTGGEKFANITVIESPNIPSVGVGEATVPSIRRTLQRIGLSEIDFMRATDATFKAKIRFSEWNSGEEFDHPFDRRERPETDSAVSSWLASNAGPSSFAETFSILSNISQRGHAPKAMGWPDYASTFPYAYHLDAVKLAGVLTKHGVKRGVRHVCANVIDVTVGDYGNIEHVTTETGDNVSGDLFIDCSGFRALLLSKALGVELKTFSEQLLCDRAVTMRIPYETHRPEMLLPYTKATARSAGWSWDIPLQGRRGAGYVYSSRHISDDDAEAELRAIEGPHSSELETRLISFTSGKRAVSWKGNCVAIGLADGFLEPLESSGLYMVEFAAEALGELLPASLGHREQAARTFNTRMHTLYEEVAEYLNLHYVTSARRDTPFWRAATCDAAVLDTLRDKLELWKRKKPSDLDFERAQRLFSLESYEYLLYGMNYTRLENTENGSNIDHLGQALEKCYEKLPLHERWLAQLG